MMSGTQTDADTAREITDQQLLEQFLARRDEAAFSGLVHRHSRTVWGVCRRMLPQEQDAEDVFQAVFLFLAQKAALIRKGEAVGSWLYGVAYRTAMNARRSASRRQAVEQHALPATPEQPPETMAACHELQGLLDDEVQALEEKYRMPFVLCCLEGLSKSEVAQELGWKEGTVSGRLAEARKQLQQRLIRRGVRLSAVLTAVAIVQQSASAAPPALVQATTNAALASDMAGVSPSATLAKGLGTTTAITGTIGILVLATLLVTRAAFFQSDPVQPKPEQAPQVVNVDERALALAFSPDGKRLVTGGAFSNPGHFEMWDVHTSRLLVALRGLGGMRSAAFSPDGEILATGHFGGEIKLRDPLTGRIRTTLTGHDMGANGLAFSPDGALLVSAGLDQSVKLWDMKTLREREEFLGHKGMVLGIAFFHHRRAIATGGEDQTARIWNLGDAKNDLCYADIRVLSRRWPFPPTTSSW